MTIADNSLAGTKAPAATPENLIDATYLRAIANLAETRGDVRFTPGGGVLFDTPITKQERLSLPAPKNPTPRFAELPQDRFRRTAKHDDRFEQFVEKLTVLHVREGYRLVMIPLSGRLSPKQLRIIADSAETFGHGTLRLTADVSIRLPNVPVALLRPLFKFLTTGGLLNKPKLRQAA